ncbi:coat protein [Cucumber vein-clearing virus]|uniref:Capsid protein n=1 Tax=Cucumber vein-clearing virus TaxID=1092564 RepID=G5D8V9_9VIRU|nr:coat protein [Cucumber vein-clearing virus]AEP83730.1 coat protein [Cucumber vein-clearing virus]WOL52748.1 coat protein [Cucumber vein-clearing virus]
MGDAKQAANTAEEKPKSASGVPIDGIEADLQKRLDALHEFWLKMQTQSVVTNPGLELGRPIPKAPAHLQKKKSSIYNKWTIDELSLLVSKPISNSMPTAEEMVKTRVTLEGLGVPTEQVPTVLLQVALYCKDSSSSSYMDSNGTFEWKGGSIMSDSVIAALRKDKNTLRRVCRLYAPLTWNYMLVHNAPPSDWQSMGFQENTKFAAFDCFDFVENPAAVQPFEGLIRKPTPAEKIANEAHKRIALDRSNRNETYANLGTEITGGRLGPEINRDFNNANNH